MPEDTLFRGMDDADIEAQQAAARNERPNRGDGIARFGASASLYFIVAVVLAIVMVGIVISMT